MNELTELFEKYSLDKLYNKYHNLYWDLLNNKKEIYKNILEIGIGTTIRGNPSSMNWYQTFDAPDYVHGNSLRAWRDYFVNANVYGVDVDCSTMFEEDRIKTYCSSSFDVENMTKIMAEIGEMDIIIDDGLHTLEANLETLQILFPYLKEGGVYVIEDINQEYDWFIDDLLKDQRFLDIVKDKNYIVHEGFKESFTRIIVIKK